MVVGKVFSLFSSREERVLWIADRWALLLQCQATVIVVGIGFVLFSSREECDLMFLSGSDFIGLQACFCPSGA